MRWQRSMSVVIARFAAHALVLASIGTTGCEDGPEVVPVSGRITLDGEAFAGARINTQPIAQDMEHPNPGPGSFGTTDHDGRYTLELATHPEPGAVVGKHHVTIVMENDAYSTNPASDLPQAPSRRLPPWFGDGSLTIEVPAGGTDSANLDLSTKAPSS